MRLNARADAWSMIGGEHSGAFDRSWSTHVGQRRMGSVRPAYRRSESACSDWSHDADPCRCRREFRCCALLWETDEEATPVELKRVTRSPREVNTRWLHFLRWLVEHGRLTDD